MQTRESTNDVAQRNLRVKRWLNQGACALNRAEGHLLKMVQIMERVFTVNADNWEKEILKSDTLAVVDFWHLQCPWCLKLNPIYSEVAEEIENVKFAKLNVFEPSENRTVAGKYGIMSTPTLVFFCEGKPVQTVVGFHPKRELKNLVYGVAEKHRECLKKSSDIKP